MDKIGIKNIGIFKNQFSIETDIFRKWGLHIIIKH